MARGLVLFFELSARMGLAGAGWTVEAPRAAIEPASGPAVIRPEVTGAYTIYAARGATHRVEHMPLPQLGKNYPLA